MQLYISKTRSNDQFLIAEQRSSLSNNNPDLHRKATKLVDVESLTVVVVQLKCGHSRLYYRPAEPGMVKAVTIDQRGS